MAGDPRTASRIQCHEKLGKMLMSPSTPSHPDSNNANTALTYLGKGLNKTGLCLVLST